MMSKTIKVGLLSAACIVAAIPLAACNTGPTANRGSMEPAIVANANRKEALTGETVMVDARTVNLGEGSTVSWAVSPNVAKISPMEVNRGLSAKFTADQPGTYIVTATAKLPDGRHISSETNIMVKGRSLTSDDK